MEIKWQPDKPSQMQFSDYENWCILNLISLKFVPKGRIKNKAVLFLIMVRYPTGNKPLPKPIMASHVEKTSTVNVTATVNHFVTTLLLVCSYFATLLLLDHYLVQAITSQLFHHSITVTSPLLHRHFPTPSLIAVTSQPGTSYLSNWFIVHNPFTTTSFTSHLHMRFTLLLLNCWFTVNSQLPFFHTG